jgi:hypothetical protein
VTTRKESITINELKLIPEAGRPAEKEIITPFQHSRRKVNSLRQSSSHTAEHWQRKLQTSAKEDQPLIYHSRSIIS